VISFWVNAAGSWAMEEYLARRAPDLMDRVRLCTYESLTPDLEVTGGAHIFSALDQLGAGGRAAVAALHDRLSERFPADRLLNHPRRVARRYELLTKLFDAGINGFRAHRAAEGLEAVRFPVFVREESGHSGALTALLGSRREIARALRALRARGYRVADLLVVEFCDVSDSEQRFRMASACKVGEHIVPAFLISGRNWMLKWNESDHGEQAMQENLDYLLGNPHEAWLRRIFALAAVDYGRIDYGVRGGTLQVWEINLNPTIGPTPGAAPAALAPQLEALRQHGLRVYHSAMQKAFRALDPAVDHARVVVRLDPALLARMRAEAGRTKRRGAALRFLDAVYRHPKIGWPFRAAYSWLLPRP